MIKEHLQNKKNKHQKIAMLTCYDYPAAQIISNTSIDAVLVGDSVAMVTHGHPSTLYASLDMMMIHTQAVARGLDKIPIVSDLPFLCHRISRAETVKSVRKLVQSGAEAIKIEGGDSETCASIDYLVRSGIAIMGHIGLTPQSIMRLGGYRVQGKTHNEAKALIDQAFALEASGCFALVLECIPEALATEITQNLTIPTIGIGAGSHTDGQILVWHDLLGFEHRIKPKFVKRYLEGAELCGRAIEEYLNEIHEEKFPTKDQSY